MCEIHGPRASGRHKTLAGGFCGDRRPEGHVFHTSRQAMIKTYTKYLTPRKIMCP